MVVDDGSAPGRVAGCLRELAGCTDLQLGPYSTQLMRSANQVLPELDILLWNHGGSGDDVESARPGRLVSVLAPTSRYAEPFVRMLAAADQRIPLVLVAGRGRFGRQVIDGAELIARQLELPTARLELGDAPTSEPWNLFCAATFEEDVDTVRRALALPNPPHVIGSVAAGVHEFGEAMPAATGIYGIAQWLPGRTAPPQLGPTEAEFLAAFGSACDYPAIQAVAAATIATHCARISGLEADALWHTATTLRTSTLLGHFAIDPVTGAQVAHRPVLTRWDRTGPHPVP
ncbi:MAG TPA: hypothetical protein VGH89_24205 [Pseudonocardia sp.]